MSQQAFPSFGRCWSGFGARGTLGAMGATVNKYLLVARLYVDLRRVASALCRACR